MTEAFLCAHRRTPIRPARYHADWQGADCLPVPKTVPTLGESGETLVTPGEHPRAAMRARLAALPAPFRAVGQLASGNLSGVSFGAAALMLASSAPDLDAVKLNEAFVAQDAAYENDGRGGIAMGHPLGAPGTRSADTAALCVGSQQGVARTIEAV